MEGLSVIFDLSQLLCNISGVWDFPASLGNLFHFLIIFTFRKLCLFLKKKKKKTNDDNLLFFFFPSIKFLSWLTVKNMKNRTDYFPFFCSSLSCIIMSVLQLLYFLHITLIICVLLLEQNGSIAICVMQTRFQCIYQSVCYFFS